MLLHSKPKLPLPIEVLTLCRTLEENGFQSFIVGGAIRDLLLARPVSDWDVATDALPEQILSLFVHAIPTGIKYGTVTVLINNTPIEVTTFRADGKYKDGRRPLTVAFTHNIEDDLARRDFTINAMAYHPITHQLVDPYRGRRDLRRKVLRTVGDPATRFAEDGLRVMRLFRFAATLGLHPDKAAIKAAHPSLLTPISKERIRDELSKLLVGSYIRSVLKMMLNTNILSAILPELAAGAGVTQGSFHKYDVLDHCLEAASCIAPRLHLRLAALLHDVGKPATKQCDTKGVHFYGHDQLGSTITESILRRLKYNRKTINKVTLLIKFHMFEIHPYSSNKAIRRFINRVGQENIDDLLELRRADIAATGANAYQALVYWNKLKQRITEAIESEHVFSLADLAIDGNDVMKATGLAPGPRVGKLLRELYDEVLDNPHLNTKKQLLELLKTRYKS